MLPAARIPLATVHFREAVISDMRGLGGGSGEQIDTEDHEADKGLVLHLAQQGEALMEHAILRGGDSGIDLALGEGSGEQIDTEDHEADKDLALHLAQQGEALMGHAVLRGEDSSSDLVLGEGTGHTERTRIGEGHHNWLGMRCFVCC